MPGGARGRYGRQSVKSHGKKSKPRKTLTRNRTVVGAYANRVPFRRNLQPFVETKTYSSANVADGNFLSILDVPTGNGAFNIVTPDCFFTKQAGTGEGEMVGDSCYSRYLTTKLRLIFPQGNNVLVEPCSITIFKIWVTAPLAKTKYTTPGINNVAQADIEAHIKQQCQEFFDSLGDKLEFRERLQGVKILEKRKVRLSRDQSIVKAADAIQTMSGSDAHIVGGTQDWYGTFKWDCKRKLHYETSQSLVGAGITHYMNRPPSGMGYPALVIYNPNFLTQGVTSDPVLGTVDRRIAVQFRSQHWYGDQ